MPAAAPLQLRVFSAFLGEHESVHGLNLPDLYSTGGCKNMWVDKFGRAAKIGGYAKQNSVAYTSHTGAQAMQVRGLFPFRKTTSGTITRHLLTVWDSDNHRDITYSTDNGLTFTWLASFDTALGYIPSFAQFGQICFMTDGKITPQQWDGTTLTNAGKTQSPVPSSSVGAAGILSGTYTYKLVSITSNGTRQYASAASTVLTVQSKQISLTWSQDADTTMKGYEIYRTTGSGTSLYLVAYVDGRSTTSYTDNISDFVILQNQALPVYGDPPPSAYFVINHKQRAWWLRTDANPTRGYFSDPGQPDSVYQAANYFDFSDTSDTVGDQITGGIGNFQGLMLVLTEHAIWSVSGTGQLVNNVIDWRRTRTNAQTGCVSGRAAVRLPAGAKYLDETGDTQTAPSGTIAYFTPLGDIRICDGNNDRIISHPIKTRLSTFNYAQRNKIWCLHDTTRQEVTWCYPDNTSVECSASVTWSYRWGIWFSRSWAFAHAIENDTSSAANTLIGGSASTAKGGYLYLLWSGKSFDGASIAAQWMTKPIYGVNLMFSGGGGQPYDQKLVSHTKRWRWADLLIYADNGNTQLTVEWLPGHSSDDAAAIGSTIIDAPNDTLTRTSGVAISTPSGGTIVAGIVGRLQRAILKDTSSPQARYLHETSIRLRISATDVFGVWALEGMELAYQVMPGLQRGMRQETR